MENENTQEAIKPTVHFSQSNGKVTLSFEAKDDHGNLLGSSVNMVDSVAVFKAVAEGTQTKLDDNLVPYVEMLAKLLPKKD